MAIRNAVKKESLLVALALAFTAAGLVASRLIFKNSGKPVFKIKELPPLSKVKRLARSRFKDRLDTLRDYCSSLPERNRSGQIKPWPRGLMPAAWIHSRPLRFVYCINYKVSRGDSTVVRNAKV